MRWFRLFIDRRAVTALEYGLIGGIVAGTILVGFSQLGNGLSSEFGQIGNCVTNPSTIGSCFGGGGSSPGGP